MPCFFLLMVNWISCQNHSTLNNPKPTQNDLRFNYSQILLFECLIWSSLHTTRQCSALKRQIWDSLDHTARFYVSYYPRQYFSAYYRRAYLPWSMLHLKVIDCSSFHNIRSKPGSDGPLFTEFMNSCRFSKIIYSTSRIHCSWSLWVMNVIQTQF